MDEKKILADIDAQWENVREKYLVAQNDYAVKHGRYFQLLPTMTDAPKDGARKTADKLTDKPYYQDKTTAQLTSEYALTIPTLAGLEIHQYKQPNGVIGFVAYLTAQVTDAKGNVQTWQRAENLAGDEDYRTGAWRIVTDPHSKPIEVTPVTPELELPLAVTPELTFRARAVERIQAIDWRFVLTRAAVGSAIAAGAIGGAMALAEVFLK